MADIETLDVSDLNKRADGANGVQGGSGEQGSSAEGTDEATAMLVSKPRSQAMETSQGISSAGSGLVALRGNTLNGATPGAAPPLSMPHPKRFSHVNINKKFLEKTSSAPGSSTASLSSSTVKAGVSNQKPVAQAAPTHSRLVTAKLTAGPQPSTTTGPGWSRPPSTGSSTTPTPTSAANPKPAPVAPPAPVHSAIQPAPVGKVIQPQPRLTVETITSTAKRDGTAKPAWSTSKATPVSANKPDAVQNDFPTAAEVAQGRTAKIMELKQAAQVAAAHKQAMAAEADAFRGVHLGHHHWDEDEGDDDNFLAGVIEFGDGRQYKIQPTETSHPSSPPHELPELATDHEGDSSTKLSETQSLLDQPVSKEDRFAEDFDRSWPRSKPLNAVPQQQREPYPNRPPSSTSSQSMHSPQDSSRVLFNERSNRLEPFSNSHAPHRYGAPPRDGYLPRRGGRLEHATSPVDSRNFRDAPPHTPPQGVQLLQKSQTEAAVDALPRSRLFGDHHAFGREKDASRRDYAPSANLTRPTSQGIDHGRQRDHHSQFEMPNLSPTGGTVPGREDRASKKPSTMGLPPISLPASASGAPAKDGDRQLPPHLSSLQSPHTMRRSTSSDQQQLLSPASEAISATGPPSAHPSVRSPVVSHPSISPRVPESPLHASAMPLVDIEEVRKAAMHSAAERAKLRRQQEEAEREKERERARRKAAELEEKMKEGQVKADLEKQKDLDKKDQETQAVKIIQEAIQSVSTGLADLPSTEIVPEESISIAQPQSIQSGTARTRSSQGGPRPVQSRRISFAAPLATPDALSPAAEAESWRSKAGPARLPAQKSPQVEHLPATTPPLLPPPVLPEVQSLVINPDEDLEVFDFSDLGRLVGEESTQAEPPSQSAEPVAPRLSRAVAADFFDVHDDGASLGSAHPAKDEERSWRRKLVAAHDHPPMQTSDDQDAAEKERPKLQIVPATAHLSTHRKTSGPSDQHNQTHAAPIQVAHVLNGHSQLRSPLTPSYREAPMSALDDTMARIKGALDGMQKPDLPKQQKWLPPALRQRPIVQDNHDLSPCEVFDVTSCAPPRSPLPAWNQFTVKLPTISHLVEQVPRKQLHMSRTQPHVRTDIYSWVPPIDGMNRRDFHLNDILFPRPTHKSGFNLVVALPRARFHDTQSTHEKLIGPRVNLPSRPGTAKVNQAGAFGRPREADGVQTWRKPASSTAKGQQPAEAEQSSSLDTTSRSPPPEAPRMTNGASLPKPETPQSSPIVAAHVKSRSLPKMPAGSDVAFYRDSRTDTGDAQLKTVSFIVGSELEDDSLPMSNGVSNEIKRPEATHASTLGLHDVLSPGLDDSQELSAVEQTGEAKKDDILAEPVPVTPPSASWSRSPKAFSIKDSPARAPDPEHLKAVWSQTSDKAELPSINSLEGIADDFTNVPFTIQDVKSEDGSTPPPSSSGPPSRMSLHEVTRAFQQVPTSSASHRSTPLPSLTSPPHTQRQPIFSLPPSHPPSTNLRPTYPGYPPSLMSSPSPTMLYPHPMSPSPVPRPMVVNGAPQYAPPLWVPLPGATPSPGGMMRPMSSPYGPQLMPYPAGTMSMYHHPPPPPNMQGGAPPQPNNVQNRPPGMSAMSPVAPQAHASHPMYATSPVLVHAHPVMMPTGHGYHGSAQPRGQARGPYDHVPSMMTHSPSTHPQNPSAYPPSPYARSPW